MQSPCLQSSGLATFADLWYELRASGKRDLPWEEEFQLEDFAPFLSHMGVTRRREDGTPYYYFYGTGLAADFGKDLTGEDVFANMTEEARTQFLQVVAVSDALEKQGVSINGRWFLGEVVTQDGRSVDIEGLTLPFYAKDGEIRRATYNTVVGGIVLGDPLGAHFPKANGREFDALKERPPWMHLSSGSDTAE